MANPIYLNANENPYNLTDELKAQIAERVKDLDFNRYPSLDNAVGRRAFAGYLGVKESQVSIGNGSDQSLEQLILTFCQKTGDLLVFENDFSMYDYYAFLKNIVPIKYDRNYKEDLDVDAVIELARANDSKLLIFSNPNNPTGQVVAREDILKLIQELADVKVVVDEAYVEFYGDSVIDEIDNYDNLYVTRTISKAVGAAALRFGAVISNEANIAELEAGRPPYNVSVFSQLAAEEILSPANRPIIEERINEIKAERDRLYKSLAAKNSADFFVYASQANFLYFESNKIEAIDSALTQAGIIIRTYSNASKFGRLTVGDPATNDKIIKLLKEVI